MHNSETIFTLQVNDSGAWRNVCKGNKEQMQEVEHHLPFIARAIGKRSKWRIYDAPFNRVIGYLEAPDFTWRPPRSSQPGETS